MTKIETKEKLMYDNQLKILVKYLDEHELLEKCFDLSTRDIDMYFETLINVKIGSPGALNVHIAALSSLFEYLMNQNFDFRSLHGYINTNEFRNKYLTKIDAGSKKEVIPNDILVNVLNKIDKYYQEKLNNEVNIVYLKQLTGLDISTLISDYNLEDLKANIDIKSHNINSGIVNSAYYPFL